MKVSGELLGPTQFSVPGGLVYRANNLWGTLSTSLSLVLGRIIEAPHTLQKYRDRSKHGGQWSG